MEFVAVQIVRFVDGDQPGWVACEFVDAAGHSHTIVEKVPVVGSEDLETASVYPRPGAIACEVIDRWRSPDGRELARITTERPWSLQSAEGASEFVVLAEQLFSR